MTVKELKEKLENIPEDAAVRFMSDKDDSLLQSYYEAGFIYYLELMREGGERAVYIMAN